MIRGTSSGEMPICRHTVADDQTKTNKHSALLVSGLWLLSLAAILITGVIRDLPFLIGTGHTVSLDVKSLTINSRRMAGTDVRVFDLDPQQFHASEITWENRASARVTDDDVSLPQAGDPGILSTKNPGFFIKGNELTVASRDGSDPAANGHSYVLTFDNARNGFVRSNEIHFTHGYLVYDARCMGVVVAFCAALVFFARRMPLRGQRLLAVGLLVAVAAALWMEYSPRSRYMSISYDTENHLYRFAPGNFRPPGFYLFSRMVDGKKSLVPDLAGYPINQVVAAQPKDRFLSLIRAQKLVGLVGLFVAAIGLLFWVSPLLVPPLVLGMGSLGEAKQFLNWPWPEDFSGYVALATLALAAGASVFRWRTGRRAPCGPLVAAGTVVLAVAWIAYVVQIGVNAVYGEYVVPETLTSGVIFLLIAATLFFFQRRSPWILPLTSILCLICYAIRPTAVFCLLPLGGACLSGLIWNRRRYWFSVCISALIFLGGAIPMTVYQRSDPAALQLSDLHPLAFALEFAGASDIPTLTDPAARDFLEKAIRQRDVWLKNPPSFNKGFSESFPSRFNDYIYKIAPDVGKEVSLKYDVNKMDGIFVKSLYGSVSHTVLGNHLADYIALIVKAFQDAIADNRFGGVIPFWMVLGASLMLIMLCRGTVGYVASLFLFATLANYLIVCVGSIPIHRLTDATDPFLSIAILLLAGTGVSKIFGIRQNSPGVGIEAVPPPA